MQKPIVSIGKNQIDGIWTVCLYVRNINNEQQAIDVENALIKMLCEDEISNDNPH